jgi:shikimate 5-dehydrogenase
MMNTYGLIGFPLKHSFSAKFFTEKFKRENIDAKYLNFEIENIRQIKEVVSANPNLKGLNVTIPYKEQVIPFRFRAEELFSVFWPRKVCRWKRVLSTLRLGKV